LFCSVRKVELGKADKIKIPASAAGAKTSGKSVAPGAKTAVKNNLMLVLVNVSLFLK